MDYSLLIAETSAAPLSLDLRLPLSALHFLEFAIWGAWWVVLGQYLDALKFSRKAIGSIYATMSLGAIIAPMFIGAIADRYFASEHVMGVSQLIGAGLLFWLAQIKTARKFYWVTLAYALVFSPTLSLVNSLAFAHIPDANRDFPMIRVLGTIGWIAANLSLKLLLKPNAPVNNRPILLAAALSLILGVFSFWLPHTPPAGAGDALPFLKALALFQDTSFAVFFGVSFLITIALAFYFSFTSIFLQEHVRVRPDNVAPLMTLGQWVELAVMFSLPWFLTTLGLKWVLAVGMGAWAVRYFIFAAGSPLALVALGIALHGVCFDFFFASGFIYVDQTAPKDIAASGQQLFGALTYGLGMYIGTELSGWLNQRLTREVVDPKTGVTERVTAWRTFWLVPAAGCTISLILFLLLFR